MLKYFIIPIALVGGLSVLSGAATAAEVWAAEGFKNPESVLYDPDRQIFYVSNVNGAPTDKDGPATYRNSLPTAPSRRRNG